MDITVLEEVYAILKDYISKDDMAAVSDELVHTLSELLHEEDLIAFCGTDRHLQAAFDRSNNIVDENDDYYDE